MPARSKTPPEQDTDGAAPLTDIPWDLPDGTLPNVHQAMAQAMRRVRAVGKWGTNTDQGYSFRSIDHFMTALNPAMAAAGVHVVPRVLQRITDESHTTKSGAVQRWVDVEVAFDFYGPDGSKVTAVTWGEARDSADKATNKALTGAFKYAIMQAFMVPTEDLPDADRDSPESMPAAAQADLAQPTDAERAAAREAALLADTAPADVVSGFVAEALRITDEIPHGEPRRVRLLDVYNRAAPVGALGSMVDVPLSWRSPGGEEQVPLHVLIRTAAQTPNLPKSDALDRPKRQQRGNSEPAVVQPPAAVGTVRRVTQPDRAGDDPWANDDEADVNADTQQGGAR